MKIKVCGITNLQDLRSCLQAEVDYIGVNLHRQSPRFVEPEKAAGLAANIPDSQRVLVEVAPTCAQMEAYKLLGFDFYQIHFDADTPLDLVQGWVNIVGLDRFWAAPRIPLAGYLPAEIIELAQVIVLDAYAKDRFGGTGQTGDWRKFAELKKQHPQKTWVLAGGLNPDNIAAAVAATGADFVDVNSGIESAPGVKDPAKLKAFLNKVRG